MICDILLDRFYMWAQLINVTLINIYDTENDKYCIQYHEAFIKSFANIIYNCAKCYDVSVNYILNYYINFAISRDFNDKFRTFEYINNEVYTKVLKILGDKYNAK